jgi:DNA polymerase III sliding clamp (beta) subunit (PCNA family)
MIMKKLKVDRKQLQEALEIVKPGLANNEVIQQSTSFAFMDGRVVTYNDELSLSCPIAGMDIQGAIKADELYLLLRKITKDVLEIESTKDHIQIIAGRSKTTLNFEKEVKLPLEEVQSKKKWSKIPNSEKFIKYIKFAMGGCSSEQSYPVLTCVHISKKGIIEGSDSYRIVQCDLGKKLPVDTILLPSSSARELLKINPQEIAKGSEGWIHFRSGDVELSCRVFEGEYPDTSNHLAMSKGVQFTFPDKIISVLERAWIFAKRPDMFEEAINLKIKGGKLEVTSKSDSGAYEEVVKVDYKGKEIEINVIPYLLMDILKETKSVQIDKEKLMFESEEKDWKYLSVLIEE